MVEYMVTLNGEVLVASSNCGAPLLIETDSAAITLLELQVDKTEGCDGRDVDGVWAWCGRRSVGVNQSFCMEWCQQNFFILLEDIIPLPRCEVDTPRRHIGWILEPWSIVETEIEL